MKVSHFEITDFRNFESVSIDLAPTINIFYGQNGSGKTSFLEALHFLGLGRSFRTRNLTRLIRHNCEKFALFSTLTTPNGMTIPVGIEKNKAHQGIIKISGHPASSLAEVATLLPLQLINADSHLLLTSGPVIRRQFLDWGVFHVEQSFYSSWQRAQRVIRQRNAHLKTATSYREISVWDDEFELTAHQLDQQRLTFFEIYHPIAKELLTTLLPDLSLELHYYPGWNRQKTLIETLKQDFSRDRLLGYTQHGPHRADLQFKLNNVSAAEILSQGQQKLAAYALRLAQGKLLQAATNKKCLFLIDDLPSELDNKKNRLVCNVLQSLSTQIFVTAIEPNSLTALEMPGTRLFHVEHGLVLPL